MKQTQCHSHGPLTGTKTKRSPVPSPTCLCDIRRENTAMPVGSLGQGAVGLLPAPQ